MGCSFRLAARFVLYALSHRQDKTYHGLCYTSRGALAGMKQPRKKPQTKSLYRDETSILNRNETHILTRENVYRNEAKFEEDAN